MVPIDEYWYHLRSQDAELPGRHLLRRGLARPGSGSSVSGSPLGLLGTFLFAKWKNALEFDVQPREGLEKEPLR